MLKRHQAPIPVYAAERPAKHPVSGWHVPCDNGWHNPSLKWGTYANLCRYMLADGEKVLYRGYADA